MLTCRCASAILLTLGISLCGLSPCAYAGGVHFGFGVDASPGYAEPPEVEYQPGVVVERTPPPPPVMVERVPAPPPVVVRHAPIVVHEVPVVVERRSSVYYYYRPSYYGYHSYRVETGGGYYSHRSYNSEEDVEY